MWGPLSLLTSWFIVSDSPYRLPFQALVSTGHLFSDTLYYVTSILDMEKGVLHSRPEALYFWGYFVVMNAFWIVVPACKWPPPFSRRTDGDLMFMVSRPSPKHHRISTGSSRTQE